MFDFDDRRTVRVKGKDEGVGVRRLVGQRHRPWPTNRLATDGPMLARTDELADAERALDPGVPGLRRVVIRGAAGIGKSRLTRAVAERAAARGWHVVGGGFAGLGDATPYSGWQPVMRSIVHDDEDVAAGLASLVPGAGDLAPLLGPFIGRRLEETPRSMTISGEATQRGGRGPGRPRDPGFGARTTTGDRARGLALGGSLIRATARSPDGSSQRSADRDRGDPAPALRRPAVPGARGRHRDRPRRTRRRRGARGRRHGGCSHGSGHRRCAARSHRRTCRRQPADDRGDGRSRRRRPARRPGSPHSCRPGSTACPTRTCGR